MTLDLRRTARALIVWAVLLTPVFSVGELLALLRGTIESQRTAYTPVYLKAGKDIISLALLGIAVVRLARSGRTNVLVFPFFAFALYIGAAVALAWATPPIALAGVRWSVPVFLMFLMYDFVDDGLLRRLAAVLSALMLLQLGVQAAQLVFMSHWFGTNAFGLAARVPGFFLIPNTAAFFAVTALFASHFYGQRGLVRSAVHAAVPVSIALTQSGTGLIVWLLITTLFVLRERRAWLLVPIGCLAAVILMPVLGVLTGRGATYVAVSGGTRIAILLNLLRHSEWLPTNFGYVTNTAVALVANRGIAVPGGTVPIIADSTYASIWGNLGEAGGIFALVFICSWVLAAVCSYRLDLYVVTIVFLLFGATTVVFEAYPMNLILAVVGAYFLKETYLPFWLGLASPPVSGHTPPSLPVDPGAVTGRFAR